jgi:hypothetical protein
MESMGITVVTIAFVWGVALFAIYSRNQKIKEQKQRRLREYEEEFGTLMQQKIPIAKKADPIAQDSNEVPKESQAATVVSKPSKVHYTNEYVEYIASRYQKLGYNIWDHKENIGIDIIAKKQKELLLVLCHYWQKNENHKLTINDIKAFRIDVNDFIESNPVFQNYKASLLLILSKDKIEEHAQGYIQELQNRGKTINYEVILF